MASARVIREGPSSKLRKRTTSAVDVPFSAFIGTRGAEPWAAPAGRGTAATTANFMHALPAAALGGNSCPRKLPALEISGGTRAPFQGGATTAALVLLDVGEGEIFFACEKSVRESLFALALAAFFVNSGGAVQEV